MPNHMMILYVEDVERASTFYEKLLRAKPLEQSPGFAMFALNAPTMLGLWKRAAVEPKVTAAAGGSELGFQVDNNSVVEAFFGQAQQLGAKVLQAPTSMDFGYTFTVADPDGNRLRVFAPT